MPGEGAGKPVRLFRLKNTVKYYDWGSPRKIPELLGEENPRGLPWAELWMGVHPGGPSEVLLESGSLSLSGMISRDPRRYLGPETAETFGTLPFLFKLLAAEKPLSIQAHPNKKQAEDGWERENARSLAPGDPARNYRDRNHKPEILAAIEPFTAMCGFRRPDEIRRMLGCFFPPPSSPEDFPGKQAGGLGECLAQGGLRAFLGQLLALPAEDRGALSAHALKHRERLEEDFPEYAPEWGLCAAFAAAWPGDPAIIAPLYLNLINLEPGEAIFLPPGVLHAYVRGFGVELMANSDNVLRGGLTAKYVDPAELLNILDFSPFRPEILKSPPVPCFNFPADCREFSLSLIRGRGEEVSFPSPGPAILVLVSGEAVVSVENRFGGEGESLRLGPGESVFIAGGIGGEAVRLRGSYTLYAAGPGSR